MCNGVSALCVGCNSIFRYLDSCFLQFSVHFVSLVTKTEINACLEEKYVPWKGLNSPQMYVHNLQLTQSRAWHIAVTVQARSI